jgi:hypothetical protein
VYAGLEFAGNCLFEPTGFHSAIQSRPDWLIGFPVCPPAGRAARILHQSFLL